MENLFVPGAPGTATEQQKILSVTRNLGIQDADIMQVTTRTIFDTRPIDGSNPIIFFSGCNNRAFPLTNLSQNRLEVGEALIIKRIYFSSLTNTGGLGVYSMNGGLSKEAISFMQSLLNIVVANSLVLKDFQVLNMWSKFNEDSKQADQEAHELKTLICIPSMQEFYATLKLNDPTAIALDYIRFTIEGVGIIYRTNQTL